SMTQTLWERYRATGDSSARSELLSGYVGLVHHCARELASHYAGDIELDELVSAGTLGLVQALEGFDPRRGLAFRTSAVPRIRGAILDDLRSRSWAPRSARTRARKVASTRAVLQQRLGREPSPREVAGELGIELDEYWHWEEDAAGRPV